MTGSSTLLTPKEEYLPENYAAASSRYTGFGDTLFAALQEQLPEVFRQLQFYRRSPMQTEDSYAEYNDNGLTFVIQLDPLCEVIVLWNHEVHTEIGSWSADPVAEAITFIRITFLQFQN